MNDRPRTGATRVRWAVAVAALVGAGFLAGRLSERPPPAPEPASEASVAFRVAVETVAERHLTALSHDSIYRLALAGLLDRMEDPHARAFDPSAHREYQREVIGAPQETAEQTAPGNPVPEPDPPAAETPPTATDAGSAGEAGTSAEGGEAAGTAGSVDGWRMLDDGLGYVRVRSFRRGAAAELEEAVTRLRGLGARGLVLDVRGNPGGLLDEAVRSADLFLAVGAPIARVTRDGSELRRWHATRPDPVTLPLAVLVDGGTASAAEVLADALRGSGRAVLVGGTTFGKRTVQTTFRLPDGYRIKFTTSRWHTADGTAADTAGLVPDHPLRDRPGPPDRALGAARRLLGAAPGG